MKIDIFPVGPFVMNCHILYDETTKTGIVIDPGDEIDVLAAHIAKNQLKISHILLTHGHIDHVAFAEHLHEQLKVPMLLHKADWTMAEGATQQAKMFGLPPGPTPRLDGELVECASFKAGPFDFEIRHTPGHSPGSVTLISHADRMAIVGDAVFQGSIGRTDLPGANHGQLIEAIRGKILTLPDDYTLYPGHGATTTVGVERRTNPFLA